MHLKSEIDKHLTADLDVLVNQLFKILFAELHALVKFKWEIQLLLLFTFSCASVLKCLEKTISPTAPLFKGTR